MTGPSGLFDANVLVSALIARHRPQGMLSRVVRAALAGRYTALISEMTIEEARSAVLRPYFVDRYGPNEFEFVIDVLRMNAVMLPPLEPPIPRYCRDPRDDYLIAQAIASGATHLLTGDRDLIALKDAGLPFAIETPAELAAELGIGED